MASRLNRITQQRQQKLERIRALGINPYPHRFHRTHTTQQATVLLEQHEASEQTEAQIVSVAGRVMAHRKMGKLSFIDLRDGHGTLQLMINKQPLENTSKGLLEELDIGDIIGASGALIRTRTGEPTVKTDTITLLTKSFQPLPEKWHGLEDTDKRFRQRYLDLISNPEVKKTFKIRSEIIHTIHKFLNQRGFIEVETPILQPIAGGALARPFVTHYHALGHDFYLRIALELHLKRLIIGGIDKVYELGRTFRNEGISTKHNPEFTLLESYEAYADYNDVMKMVEKLVSYICKQVLGTTKIKYGNKIIDFNPPWSRVDLRQTIIEHCSIDFAEFPDADSLRSEMQNKGIKIDPHKDRGRLIDELISTYVEPNLIQPTFLIDYPIEMSPLAKSKPDNEQIVERFEGYAGGMEIANAFTELNDPAEQRARFSNQQQGRQKTKDEPSETVDHDFLLALEYGMPPTGGLGMGIDRLVMLLANKQSIREVILFPQLKEKP